MPIAWLERMSLIVEGRGKHYVPAMFPADREEYQNHEICRVAPSGATKIVCCK